MTKWFEEEKAKLANPFHAYISWSDAVEVLAKEYVPEDDQKLIVTTYDLTSNGVEDLITTAYSMHGEYVNTFDYMKLTEKFLLACCYIKELEAHNETQEQRNNELYALVKDMRESVEAAQQSMRNARAQLKAL